MGNLSGYPDIIACVDGYLVGIELKRPDGKGKATAQQENVKDDIIAAGGFAIISSSFEDIVMFISTVQYMARSKAQKRHENTT